MNKEVGVRLKVGASGTEQVDALRVSLRDMGVDTTLLDAKLSALDAELAKLDKQQGLIDTFERVKVAVTASDTAMQAAKAEAGALARALAATKDAAAQQRQAFDGQGNAARALALEFTAQKARAAELAAETKRLAADQGLINAFKAQKQAVSDAGAALSAARDKAAALGRALADTEAPTKAQEAAFTRARTAARAADDAYTQQRLALQALRGQMATAGIASDDLAGAQVRVRQQTADANQALVQSREETARLAEQQKAGKEAARQLATELAATEKVLGRQEAATVRARKAARDADDAYTAQRLKLQDLRSTMTAAGVASDGLAAAQIRVRAGAAQARQAIAETADWAQRMATAQRAGATAADLAAAAAGRQAPALRQVAAAAQQATGQLAGIGEQLRGLANIGIAGILGSQTAQMLRGVAETADAYANLGSRVKLVTGDGLAFTSAMAGIADVALRTNSNLEATGTLFTRLAQAGLDAGLSTQQASTQALALTETINQAVQLSGASAQASNAAVTQLIQGLQSGVLRGDEFNSVMEQAPRLAQALAVGLGTTTGELRKMAEEGKLSSQAVISALQSQAGTLQKEFGTLPETVGRSLENLRTKWSLFVGDLDNGTGATAAVAGGINVLADNLDDLAGIAERAGTVLVAALAVQGVKSLRSLAGALADTGGAIGAMNKRLDEVPRAVNVTVAVIGLEIGYQLGQLLYENSALARKLGIGVVQYFAVIVDGLQLAAEAAKAVFTDDTVGKAFDRYTKRAEDQKKIFEQMYKDAEQAPGKFGDAANKAGDASTELAKKAKEAGDKIALAGDTGAAGVGGVAKAAETAGQAIGVLVESAKAKLPALGEAASQQMAKITAVGQAGAVAAQALVEALPQAIQKLNGPELEQFRERMVGALSAAEEASRSLAARLAADGKDNRAALADADRAAFLLKTTLVAVGEQAAKSLGIDVAAASGKVTEGFTATQASLETLLKSLPQLAAAGIDTGAVVGQALAKMIDGAKNQAEIDAVIGRVEALGRAGTINGDIMAGALDRAAQKTIDLRKVLEDATPGMQSLGDAARQAGVDVGLLTGGLTDGGRKAVEQVRDLVQEIINYKVAAERASPVLAEAFDKRIEAAATLRELERLEEELKRAAGAGKIYGSDLQGALEAVKRKGDDLRKGINSADEAMRKLGLTTSSSLRQGAKDGQEAYQVILKAGQEEGESNTAWAARKQAAAEAMVGRMIEANRGFLDSATQAAAAQAGVTLKVDEFGKATVQTLEQAAKDLQNTTGAVKDLDRALDGARERTDQLAGAFNRAVAERNAQVKSIFDPESGRYDKDGFALGSDGQRLTVGTPGASSGGTGAGTGGGAAAEQKVFDWQGYMTAINNMRYVTRPSAEQLEAFKNTFWKTVGGGALSAGNGGSQAMNGGGLFGRKDGETAQQPAPAAAPPSTSTVRVVVDLTNQPSKSINVASRADANALTDLVRQLTEARRLAGG